MISLTGHEIKQRRNFCKNVTVEREVKKLVAHETKIINIPI